MTTYRAFPSTNGPAAVTATSGGWLLGCIFSTLGQMSWMDGYWAWVPNNGDTTPRKCSLWNIYATSTQALVPDTTVTSGILTQGQWNFIPLPAPVQLAPGALFCGAQGWTVTTGIPVTSGQFGSGEPFTNGIVNGPLTFWASLGGNNLFPAPSNNYDYGQMLFSNVLGSDPSVAMPNNSSGSDNLWVDVQLDSDPPAGYAGSYRFWPNTLDLGNNSLDTANNFTLGFQFSITEPCQADNIWFYSPPTVTQLPTGIGIFKVAGQALVASNLAPSWSGAAGSGWIWAPMGGATILTPGTSYKACVVNSAAVPAVWNAAVANYWSTGFGINGLTSGPLAAPNTSAATPSQESYNLGALLTYPNTTAGPYRYGIDIEVTPVTLAPAALAAAGPGDARSIGKRLLLLGW